MKKYFVFCLAILLAFGVSSALLAQETTVADTAATASAKEETKDKKEFKGKGRLEQIETSGVLKVTPADASKNQKYATILLVCGDKEYKLLPGREKTGFAELEKMDGQTVTVKGGLMPATEKYPLPAIKVDEIPGVSKAGNKPLKGEPTGKGKAREKM